jgi:Flp pilus assembly protein TadG
VRRAAAVLATRLGPGERGAAAAEFALLMPILLLLLFGIIDFGRMLNAQITLTQAAREGARAQAFGLAPAPRVREAAEALSGVRVGAGPSCPANGAASTANAVVTASYTFEFVTPVGALAALFGSDLGEHRELTGKGVMPCMP